MLIFPDSAPVDRRADYIDLRGIDAEAKLLADTITIYRDALRLTQDRLAAKIAPPIDVPWPPIYLVVE